VLKQRINNIGSTVKGNWSLAQQSTLRATVQRVPFAARLRLIALIRRHRQRSSSNRTSNQRRCAL